MSGTKVSKLADVYELGLTHMFISRQLQDLYARTLAPYKMGTLEWLLLGVVQKQSVRGGIRITDLARIFDVKTTYITATVNALKEKQYVRSVGDAHDARVRLVTITPEGSEIFANINQLFQKELDKILKDKVTSNQLMSYVHVAQQIAGFPNKRLA